MNPDFLDVAVAAAKTAGRVQKKYLHRSYGIGFKGESNLVTEVDLLCEERILSRIRSRFPDHGFFAEEGGEVPVASPYRWIIDPLDGTTNYAHGYPCFCTSIALEERGEIIVGVVYDPLRNELFTACKGQGARLNTRSIRPSGTDALDRALLVTGFPYHVKETRQNLDHFERFTLTAQAVRRDGSAALDLCYTAMGRFDGFWEFSLSPWDLAAGALILGEAGGRITRTNGRPFSINKGDVLASNGRIHRAMLRVLHPRQGGKAPDRPAPASKKS